MHDRAAVASEAETTPVARPPVPQRHASIAQVLGLQRSAGNAAVARLVSGPEGEQQQAAASPVAALAQRAGSPAGLRAMLAADPRLAGEISSYFAAGNDDAALNALLGQAFAPAATAETRRRRARRRGRRTPPCRSRRRGRATRSSPRAG